MEQCHPVKTRPAMGTMAWGKRKGPYSQGRLTRPEKRTLLTNVGRIHVSHLVDWLFGKAGWIDAYGADLDGLMPPDTRLVRDSLDLAEETLGLEVIRHSWRTYYWAVLLGGYRGLAIDREILFAASILHDLGLAKDRPVHPGSCCFVVHGADRCKSHLVSEGHDRAKVRQIADAVGLHLNGYVSRKLHGNEAHLLSRGAMMDVFGLGRFRVEKNTRAEVHKLYPKTDLMNGLEVWKDHHLIGTRADMLIRLGGAKTTRPDAAAWMSDEVVQPLK